MTKELSIQELDKLQAQAKEQNTKLIALEMMSEGAPKDVVTALQVFAKKVGHIGQKVYEIGKILFLKIWEFIKAHEGMAIGIAIAAAVSALSAAFTSTIPFIGVLLAPIVSALVACPSIPAATIIGNTLDNDRNMNTPTDAMKEAIIIAKDFFKLLVEMFNVVKDYITKKTKKEQTWQRKQMNK